MTEASRELRSAIGHYPARHPVVARATWNLARAHFQEGHCREARTLLEGMLQAWQQDSDADPGLVADFEVLLAIVLSETGEHVRAALLLRSGLEVYKDHDPDDDRVRNESERLAVELRTLGMVDEAVQVQLEVAEWHSRVHGATARESIQAAARAAWTMRELGRVEEARGHLMELVPRAREAQDAALVLGLKRRIIETLMDLGDWPQAARLGQEIAREASEVTDQDDDFVRFARRWHRQIESGLSPLTDGTASRWDARMGKRILRGLVKTPPEVGD